jgi:phage shock protein E
MFTQSTLLTFFLFIASLATPTPAHTAQRQTERRQISAERLKSWYKEKKPMIVLDARTEAHFNGVLLPHAKWLPEDSPKQKIQAKVPDKDKLIVVYCFSVDCPASRKLYDKLISMGYSNVYDYHGGLKDWEAHGYPTVKE